MTQEHNNNGTPSYMEHGGDVALSGVFRALVKTDDDFAQHAKKLKAEVSAGRNMSILAVAAVFAMTEIVEEKFSAASPERQAWNEQVPHRVLMGDPAYFRSLTAD